jgi:hypothetical protein
VKAVGLFDLCGVSDVVRIHRSWHSVSVKT